MRRFVASAATLAFALVFTFILASCGPSRVPGVASVGVSSDAAAEDAEGPPDGGALDATSDDADADNGSVGDGSVTETAVADATTDAGDETSAPGDSPCAGVCAVLGGTACPPDPTTCPAGCAAQIADLCGDQSRALLACQAGLSPADFTCDSKNRLVMDPSKCQTENDALVTCLLGG